MRRLTTAAFAVATTAAVLTLSTGTAFAHGPERSKGASHPKAAHAKAEHKKKVKKEKKHHPKVKMLVTMTGVVTDTATAVILVTPTPSDSPTALVSESPTPAATDSPTPAATDSPTPAATDSPTALVSDSPTPAASESPAALPAMWTLTVAVKGGERSLHRTLVVLTFDKNTVVRRGDRPATVADLRPGDHVSVRARRMPDGSWLALRVNAAPRETED